MGKISLALALILALALASSVAFADGETVTVTLGPGRDASQTGTAMLTARGNQTEVVIDIQPGAAGVQQPAHIHEGSCPGVGAVKYPLTNVSAGKSTTMVNAPLTEVASGKYSINVHKGPGADAGVYVACGNIQAFTPTTLPRTGDAVSDYALPAALLGAAVVLGGFYLRRQQA